MSEQQLDGADVGAGFQEVDGKGVAERVGRNRLGDAAAPMDPPAGAVDGMDGDRVARARPRKEPVRRVVHPPPVAQHRQQRGGEHHIPVFLALPLRDPEHHPLTVNRRPGRAMTDLMPAAPSFPIAAAVIDPSVRGRPRYGQRGAAGDRSGAVGGRPVAAGVRGGQQARRAVAARCANGSARRSLDCLLDKVVVSSMCSLRYSDGARIKRSAECCCLSGTTGVASRPLGGVMRRAVVYCCVLIAVVVLPAYGQQRVDVEAEIKVAVPYTQMLIEFPAMTLEEYNAAVRAVASERVGMPAQPFATLPRVSSRTASPPSLEGSDGTYLGVLSGNRYDPNSVSNPYGKYGSRYSPTSINNPYSTYGSPYSPNSATNPYATQAPKIVNPYLGRLSANPYAPDSTSNPYGKYGSKYSPTSINNPYSTYGSPYSPSSVMTPYAISPSTPLAPLALPSLELPSLELPPLYPR